MRTKGSWWTATGKGQMHDASHRANNRVACASRKQITLNISRGRWSIAIIRSNRQVYKAGNSDSANSGLNQFHPKLPNFWRIFDGTQRVI